MADKLKVVHYVNQFFGNIGGEEKAGIEPFKQDEPVGPAIGLNNMLGEAGEVVATVICGDNYFNEHEDEAVQTILEMVSAYDPDVLVTGPAFNAGRYGMACGKVGQVVADKLDIPVVSGMYHENPGVETAKSSIYIVETSDSAAGMREALPKISQFVLKLGKGEEMGTPQEEGYIPQGKRVTVFADKIGSTRAVEMLLARLNDEPFETELPVATFDRVAPAKMIENLKEAEIALVCTGGIVPAGNPDRIESASASKYGKYSLEGVDDLPPENYETIHGGYDPVYANEDPNRVLPLDVLRALEKEGAIGKVHDYFYSTVGTGTAVASAESFGKEIGEKLKADGVDGVILTST